MELRSALESVRVFCTRQEVSGAVPGVPRTLLILIAGVAFLIGLVAGQALR
jgi:hypothetical protein